jgi:hypothetical protein
MRDTRPQWLLEHYHLWMQRKRVQMAKQGGGRAHPPTRRHRLGPAAPRVPEKRQQCEDATAQAPPILRGPRCNPTPEFHRRLGQ